MTDYRIEKDSKGEVKVPKDKYWGAQTERSYENFPISHEKMPAEIIEAFAQIKKAAALTNYELGLLAESKKEAIIEGAEAIIDGEIDQTHFPLVIWQTGSGTQTNMNVNEVIANYTNLSAKDLTLHPNDDVNQSQSSNDTFPSAMSIAGYSGVVNELIPEIEAFIEEVNRKKDEFDSVIKIGRTHLQDAVPLSFEQELSGWAASLENNLAQLEHSVKELRKIALGGTAVGTGLNAPDDFSEVVVKHLREATGLYFVSSDNKFTSLSFKSEFSRVHGILSSLAADLMKIANDVRWLSSGPRAGLGEMTIPANEPGSSIMPGKVNPTQAEALTMAAVQVMGNHSTINFAASQGNFQLNVYLPLIASNFLQSVRLLTDDMGSFRERCLAGITINEEQIKSHLNNSLMLVTALTPEIGYDKAAEIAHLANEENISLKEATLHLGYLSEEDFDRIVDPEKLI